MYLFIGESFLFSRFSETSLLFVLIVILQKNNRTMSKNNARIAEALEVLYEDEDNSPKQEMAIAKLNENRQLKGLAGIAEIFSCSIATASRIKKSGIIDPAISQIGRTFVVDEAKALELAKLNKKKNRSLGRKHL